MKSADMLNLQPYATAQNCYDAMIEKYEIEGYDAETALKIGNIRYELTRLLFSYENPVTIADEVSDETVAMIKEDKETYLGADVRIVAYREYVDSTIAPHILGTVRKINAEEYNEKKDASYFFKNVKKIFKNDDLTIVNFEGTLTKRNTRAQKTFAFKGNPSYLKILQKGNVDAVSFANNHCRDYGEGSYQDTISVFKKNKMPYASYGKVSVYKTKGKKIGMIAVNGLEGVSSSEYYIKKGIQKLKKKKVNLIIVSMHAGIEKTSSINDVQKSIAHYAVQHGANLVLGHHPHTLQGIEKYKGAYIVYSLANFCFGGNTNPADKDTMIFQQTFTFKNKKLKKTKDVKIIPCKVSSSSNINNYQPTPAKGAAKKRIISKMNSFCKPYNLSFNKNGKLK